MGMRQRRCPGCGKRRPYNEGGSLNDTRRREDRWVLKKLTENGPEVLVCYRCAPEIFGKDYIPPHRSNSKVANEILQSK